MHHAIAVGKELCLGFVWGMFIVFFQISTVIIYEYPDISAFKFFAALYPYDLSAMITWLHTIHNAGVPLVCCGEKMKELVPNTVEASGEKHLPVAELSGSRLTVIVGAVEHPMADVHYIQWIFVETENGGQIRYLNPGQAPNVGFELGSEKPVAVYAYCNLHGLWMTKL